MHRRRSRGRERGAGRPEHRSWWQLAGASVVGQQLVVADRPARGDQARARHEVDRIELQAAGPPQIGRAAEPAGHGDAHIVMDAGRHELCRRQLLDGCLRSQAPGFEQQDRQAQALQLHRKAETHGTRSDDADLVGRLLQSRESMVDHSRVLDADDVARPAGPIGRAGHPRSTGRLRVPSRSRDWKTPADRLRRPSPSIPTCGT